LEGRRSYGTYDALERAILILARLVL
jgi:hypothetical protein